MADLQFTAVPDWFAAVTVLNLNDPLLQGKIRLSTFQVVYDDTLPLFFRVAEAPDSPYVNMKKFIDIVGHMITSPEDNVNKRIKTIHVDSTGASLVIEYLAEN